MVRGSRIFYFLVLMCLFLINQILAEHELWGDCYHYNKSDLKQRLCFKYGTVPIYCHKLVDEERGKCMPAHNR